MWLKKLYFDKQDRELLLLVNKVVHMRHAGRTESRTFDANLHPHGVKELAMTGEMHVAQAVVKLLDSLEAGQSDDRLHALRTLYDEVLGSAQTSLRRNTARVLIQIMKELVRAHGDEARQMRLARDFRRAAQGTPRIVRRLLNDYHLVEMPEDWSQLTFDHHVHDANTKGRKNPTHLIMDAWIKGIRYLTVVYYNYVNEEAAREIMCAADIMGMSVRIGIEFSAPFRGRYVNFIWVPRGFANAESFMEFLAEPPMRHFMKLGREASAWHQRYVFRVLQEWNQRHRHELARQLDMDVPEMDAQAFRAFVGGGQPSLLHLAEYIHNMLHPLLHEKFLSLTAAMETATEEEHRAMKNLLAALESQTPAAMHDAWLAPEKNPCLPSPYLPEDTPDTPELLRLSPMALLDWLTSMRAGYRISLNLADLTAEDVLELLWTCQGYITHLEIFNLKDWSEGRLAHLEEITELLRAVNRGSAPRLKRFILELLKKREENPHLPEHAMRCAHLRAILRNIPLLQSFYSTAPLRTRMGTDSTSRAQHTQGMGLVFTETLNARGQKFFRAHDARYAQIPFTVEVERHVSYAPNPLTPQKNWFTRLMRGLPGGGGYGYLKSKEWISRSSTSHMGQSNIATLGGSIAPQDGGFAASVPARPKESRPPEARYLNTRLSNALKVLAGFLPAMCAFQYTQSWWFLAWFGPVIWFAVTGFRNIVQAVMAGGGFHRSSLLRWNDHVSWRRLCDSLMYTGFSVPILELGVRMLFLQETLGYTVGNHPVLTYAAMSAANGLYIAWHNTYRGLPREAVIGNLFRNALAIPVAVLYSESILDGLSLFNVENPLEVIQPGAAIISKMASDTVAAAIEGYADRQNNIRMRRWDYDTKLRRMFDTYARLELLFPEEDLLAVLGKPKRLLDLLGGKHAYMLKEIIVNALDFMYFWLYQPRAQDMFMAIFRDMSEEERMILLRSQLVLAQEREVSQLFVNGLVGRDFGRALAFYLGMHEKYLRAMLRLMPGGK